jgi:hypothetical protein
MKNPFQRKRKVITLADVSSRLRGFILDSQINDAHELAVVLGCSPISDEVALREEDESERRVAEISLLTPLLYAFAHSLAEASVEHQKSSLSDSEKVPDEIWLTSRRLIEQVAISVLIGSISQLVDMKLLEVPKKLRRFFRD